LQVNFVILLVFIFFVGKPEQNSYSIYDKVMYKALRKYGQVVTIPYTGLQYKKYLKQIDIVRKKKVSRNGFDHLLWYYFKGN